MHQPGPGLDTRVVSSLDLSLGSHRFIPFLGVLIKSTFVRGPNPFTEYSRYAASDWPARVMTSHFLFLPGALPFSAVDRGLRGWDGLGLAEIFGQEGGFVLVEWVCLRRAVVPYCIFIYFFIYKYYSTRMRLPHSFRPVTRSDLASLRPQYCHPFYLFETLNVGRKGIADSQFITRNAENLQRRNRLPDHPWLSRCRLHRLRTLLAGTRYRRRRISQSATGTGSVHARVADAKSDGVEV